MRSTRACRAASPREAGGSRATNRLRCFTGWRSPEVPKLQAPASGVTIRMYRQGHGDCFVLAFPRDGGGDPVYVLIDCGLKPGSQEFIHRKGIDKIVAHISDATGAHLDLAVI